MQAKRPRRQRLQQSTPIQSNKPGKTMQPKNKLSQDGRTNTQTEQTTQIFLSIPQIGINATNNRRRILSETDELIRTFQL